MLPALVADGLQVTLRDRERTFTLSIDDLAIMPGEAVGITGASGTGKTLLLEVLGLLKRPDGPQGDYLLAGPFGAVDLNALWKQRGGRRRMAMVRGAHFGFVPQSGGLLPFLSVKDNISLTQRVSRRRDDNLLRNTAERLGLSSLLSLFPHQLSIGQRQRATIARALVHRPTVVIADEPTAALDPDNAAGAMALLHEAVTESGSALIVSSHDLVRLDALPMTRYALQASTDDADGSVHSRVHRAGGAS